jgi:O-antigen ligase
VPYRTPTLRQRVPSWAGAAAAFAALGVALAMLGSTSPLLLAPVVLVWAAVILGRIGTGPVVTVSMMAVAFTAPMNGIRIFGVLALTDLVLTVGILGLAVQALVSKRWWSPLPRGFTLGTALVVAGGLVGALFAAQPRASFARLLPFTLAATVPVIAVRMWGPSQAMLKRYLWCSVAGAVASGAVGLFSGGGLTGRPQGLTPHPNHLAMTCALGATLALALRLCEVGWRRTAALGAFCLLALSVVRAGSRAGLIAMLIGAAIVVLRTRHLRPTPLRVGRGLLVLLVTVLVAGAFIFTGAVKLGEQNALRRLVGDVSARASDAERLPLLQENVAKIGDRPLTGGGFQDALAAHNIYVQVWVAAGIAGFVGFLMLITSVVREGLREDDEGSSVEMRYIRTAYLAGYVGYLVAGLAQNILWDRYIWLHVAIIISARAAAPGREPTPQPALSPETLR